MTYGSIFQFYDIYFAELIIYLVAIGNYCCSRFIGMLLQLYISLYTVWFVTNNVWKLKSYKLLYCAVFYFFQMFKKNNSSYLLHFSQLF